MVNPEEIKAFFALLNQEKLNYVLLKNDLDEIPYAVKDGDDVDILIHPEDYETFLKVCKENGYQRFPGESYKYFFVY